MAETVTAGTGPGRVIALLNTQLTNHATAAQPAGNDALARSVSVLSLPVGKPTPAVSAR